MSVAPIITLESDDPTRESEMPIQGSKYTNHCYQLIYPSITTEKVFRMY